VSQRRITPVLVLLLFGLSIALMAPSTTAGTRRQPELVVGRYSCSYDDQDAWSSLMFDATGHIVREEVSIYRIDVPSLPPSEHCSAKTAKMHEATLTSGCQTSGLEAQAVGEGGETVFHFLCRGNRDGIIHDLAGVVGHILGVGGP
jgi:hypothetical protein